MSKKQKREAKRQWILPFLILIIVIIALLINFTFTGRKASREQVEKTLENKTTAYADKLYYELELMTKSGLPISTVLGQCTGEDSDEIINLMKALQVNTDAYQVVLTDMQGKAITQDGIAVDVSKESYFKTQPLEQIYEYTSKDCIVGKSAIISSIPVMKHKQAVATLYLYYPMEKVATNLQNTIYVDDTFYAVTLDDGSIICKTGFNTNYITEQNLYTMLSKEPQSKMLLKAQDKIKQGKSGSIAVEKSDRLVHLVYAPLKIHNWYLFMGIKDTSIHRLIENDWQAMGRIVKQLLFTILAVLLYLIVMIILNKIKYTENSKNLEEKADTDLLTELYNKIATEREIKDYISEKPTGQALLFLIDIDNFKKINDTMGHAFGDEVLKTIGAKLKMEFRKSDICGRVGGDEMLIFLKDIEDGRLQCEAERVIAIYKNFGVGEYVKYTVTASIGAAVYSRDGKTFEELYKAADQALYRAKRNGKNQLMFYKKGNAENEHDEHS